MLIRELMTSPAVTVTGQTPIGAALRLMDERKITSLPVVDHHGGLIGIVSEADLVSDGELLDDRFPVAAVRATAPTPTRRVAEVMTHLVVTVRADDELEVAIDLMRSTMMKSLPAIEQGRVIGMISRSDVIHLLAGRDQRIRTEVGELLNSESPGWQVQVQDGIVTVTGPADPHERRLAELLSGTVRGVVAVQITRLSEARPGAPTGR
ncbi:BON domain-containing protein [Kribbella voronezhensis]|uniref:BON domain-containing protein n=1 Tax=Kribbella voronezhensis TaxID=2512212 RepID=A0A4R7SWN4_9ACTN|nr:CBS domain-containing protein [Kribbella voronezhensis]TDU83770.1 BON domain-containing protein [Kribbella voronezhensis]